MRRHFLSGLGIVTVIVCPLSIGICLLASYMRTFMLGPAWHEATPLIALCAVYALFDSIGQFTHNVFTVLNREQTLVVTMAVVVTVRFPLAIWMGLHFGMIAAVETLTATALLNAIVWLWCVGSLLDIPLADLIRPLWRTFSATAVMAAVLLAAFDLQSPASPSWDTLLRFTMISGVGAAVQISVQLGLWVASGRQAGPETVCIGLARSVFDWIARNWSRRISNAVVARN